MVSGFVLNQIGYYVIHGGKIFPTVDFGSYLQKPHFF